MLDRRQTRNRSEIVEQARREFWNRKREQALEAEKIESFGILFERLQDFS